MRPQVGSYHCFGCGEGGDVISFVQKVDHLVHRGRRAARRQLGLELRYEDGGPRGASTSLGGAPG